MQSARIALVVISAVFVSYRSGSLVQKAMKSLRLDAEDSRTPLQIICVVNSGDPTEAALASEGADIVITPATNLGYGGGLNAGVEKSLGDVLVLSNPDVLFLPGMLAGLTQTLEPERLQMAGPATFWDEGQQILIPPADEPTPREMLRRSLALRNEGSGLLFRRDLRRALIQRNFVLARQIRRVQALSGAVMAVSRSTWERVGPFDEGFRLYYEENDWQARLKALKGDLLHVGGARVIHKFNQSARREPRSAGWFAASEERYLRIHHGDAGLRALGRLRSVRTPDPPPLPLARILNITAENRFGIAVSPSRAFRPFAFSVPPAGSWTLPPDLLENTSGETWFARIAGLATGESLGDFQLASQTGPAM